MTKQNSPVVIKPMTADHIESFHQAFNAVARERRFLTFLQAPPLEETRAFALASVADGNPHFVAVTDKTVVGWCDIRRLGFPTYAHRGSLGMGLIDAFRGRGWVSNLSKRR